MKFSRYKAYWLNVLLFTYTTVEWLTVTAHLLNVHKLLRVFFARDWEKVHVSQNKIDVRKIPYTLTKRNGVVSMKDGNTGHCEFGARRYMCWWVADCDRIQGSTEGGATDMPLLRQGVKSVCHSSLSFFVIRKGSQRFNSDVTSVQ